MFWKFFYLILPYFILTCTSPSEVTHVCLLDLDSTASRNRHGLLLCPDPQAQAIRVSPYQICAHQAFACRNWHNRRAPRPPARKSQKSGQPKANHAPQLAPENLPRAASDSSLPNRLLGSRAAQMALSSTDLLGLRIWWSYDIARATWVSGISFTRRWT